MKCVIPGLNVKTFGQTVHSLSKIGNELYLEPMQEGLVIRTVNSTRSAYAYILFAPSFFSNYDDGSSLVNSNGSYIDEGDILRCKLNMRSMLTVFKSLSSIEKSVERCKISLNLEDSRLVFQLYCKHGIIKTHNLSFIECETLQAVFSKDLTPNKLTAHPKLLCDAVVNFQNNQEEVTLITEADRITLKNYVEDEIDPKKIVLTTMHLNPKEFDNCQLHVDAEITFCLKEFRAILGLADVISLPLNIHFERAGRPVVISIDSDVTFEATFVLATLADAETSSSQPKSVSNKICSSKQISNSDIHHEAPKSITYNNVHNGEFEDDFEEIIYNDPTVDKLTSMVTVSSTREDNIRHEALRNSTTRITTSNMKRFGCSNGQSAGESISSEVQNQHLSSNIKSSNSHSMVASNLALSMDQDSPTPSTSDRFGSPVIPFQSEPFKPQHSAQKLNESAEMQDLDEDQEEDLIPGTPPSKKFKSMVFSQRSTQSLSTQQAGTVLAEDTDEDD